MDNPKSTFLGVGVHDVTVKSVTEHLTKKGYLLFKVVFGMGQKTINMSLFPPTEDRDYNPKSLNSIKLEAFLNYTMNLDIVPGTENYSENLLKGLSYFSTPAIFSGRKCQIKVDYPYSALFADEVGSNQFQLKYGNGNEYDDTIFPDLVAAEAHVKLLNTDREEGNYLRFTKYPEVLFINPSTEPQDNLVLDAHIEEEDNEDYDDGF